MSLPLASTCTALLLAVVLAPVDSRSAGWTPDPTLVERLSRERPGIDYHQERVPADELPPLARLGGLEGGKLQK